MRVGGSVCALAVLSAFTPAEPAGAQLQGAGVLDVGAAGSALSFAHGADAIGVNPAALGLSNAPRWSVAVLPVVVGREANTIGWGEVNRWRAATIPVAEREDWLDRVAAAGTLRGRLDARVTAFAVQAGDFGIQMGSRATGQMALNEGAAELFLFGNAGRSGRPAQLELRGSSLDVEWITSIGLAWGWSLRQGSSGDVPAEFAVGFALTYHEGQLLIMGRDESSEVRAHPPEVDLQFPLLESESGSAGRGAGLSLGLVWARGPLRIDFALHDVVNGFRWREDAFRYRPTGAFLSGDRFETATDLRPIDEAPAALRAELRARGLPVRARLGAAVAMPSRTTVSAEFARGAVGDLPGTPTNRFALGARHVLPTLPLTFQAGFGVTGDGPRLGGGLEARWGNIVLAGALLGGSGTGGDGLSAALGVALRAR